jgi:aminotransferase
MDSVTFARELLEKQKVAVVPGVAFGPSGEGHVRLSYATGLDQIKEALQRIKKFISSL